MTQDSVDFNAAFARMQEVTGLRTQIDLADFLNIRQSSISDAKRRGSLPDAWLIVFLREKGVNPTWILSGLGPKYMMPVEDEQVAVTATKQESDITRVRLALHRAITLLLNLSDYKLDKPDVELLAQISVDAEQLKMTAHRQIYRQDLMSARTIESAALPTKRP